MPVEKGGEGTAPSPMESLLHCLAACSAVDVISILKKMRTPASDLRVEITAERAENHPKVFTAVHLHFVVKGDVPEKKLAHALELSSTTFCSVSAMLKSAATITYDFEILPD